MATDLEGLLRSAKRVAEREAPTFPPSARASDLEPVETDPDSYESFTSLTRYARIGPVLFGLALPFFIGGTVFFVARAWLFPILVGWYACIGLALLVNRVRYRTQYLGWEKRLPFELVGWREMLSKKRVYCDLCWTDVAIAVTVTRPEASRYVRAALDLFCARTKAAFYQRAMSAAGSDRRSRWSVKTETAAEGSANPDILREMKRLFQRDLSLVANRTKGISRVTVTVLSKEFQEPIEISTSEGTAT